MCPFCSKSYSNSATLGFVLLPRQWVGERSFAWAGQFGRLARDNEQLQETLVGLRRVAFATLMLERLAVQGDVQQRDQKLIYNQTLKVQELPPLLPIQPATQGVG